MIPMKRLLATALAAVVLHAAFGCAVKKKSEIAPAIANSEEALFTEGQKYLKKDPEKALIYLRQVVDSFPQSFYAQRALLAIADSYYAEGDEGNLILAAAQYRDFLNLYPTSPSASLAQYRVGLCSYEKVLKPGRDQTKTTEALAEFKKTIALFPLSEEAKLAREKIKECEERIAEHLYGIGYHYYRSQAYRAAIDRLTEIPTNYPLFGGMDRVYFAIGDSYFLWNKPAEAVPFFTKLVTDYPKIKLAVKAQARLKEIEEIKKKAPAPAPAPAPIKK
jgi:outer membrane protein assembly factor BamD